MLRTHAALCTLVLFFCQFLPFEALSRRAHAGDVTCALGQAPMPIAGSGKQVCSDGLNAYGPFPEGMRQECRALGQTFCNDPAWPLLYALSLRGFESCPKGTLPEPRTAYCSDSVNMYGPFPANLRAKCHAASGGPSCELNSYGRVFALSLLGLNDAPPLTPSPAPRPVPGLGAVGKVVAEIRARRATGAGTFQDLESRGIFPTAAGDFRSEQVYLPFVLGPRRQVDQMVRQLYLLLPTAIRSEVAFLIPDRFVQNPEAYLPYIKSRARVVVIASFVGVGDSVSRSSPGYIYARGRHDEELWQLRKTLEAAIALGKPISHVVLGMGDSTTDFGPIVRTEVQARVDELTRQIGVQDVTTPVTWGADELVPVAFARQLPERGIKVWFSNPSARHTWDGRRTTIEIVNEKIRQTRMRVEDVNPDIWSVVLSRRPGPEDSYAAGDNAQEQLDEALLRDFRNMPEAEARITAIIDGRAFNGAWNNRSAFRRCDLLAYGGWGTFGNNVGQTLATAKIVRESKNTVAQKQLLLEAVAHDVYSIGYLESQAGRLSALVSPFGIRFEHYGGYNDAGTTNAVFAQLNTQVNRRMKEHYAGTGCVDGRTFRNTAQLWRTFESEVHIWPPQPGEVFGAGVYRPDLAKDWFSPTQGLYTSFDLPKLTAEGCCG